MGNTPTKEQRPPAHLPRSSNFHGSSPQLSPSSPSRSESGGNGPHIIYTSRHGFGSRSELSSLLRIGNNVGNGGDRDFAGPESRRETRVEREARRLERERINREKERERSMKEESVDGGFLVTQGVYTGIEDYNKAVVRQLMIERRIAPFWRGLNDHSSSWKEHQLVAVARGLPLPSADDIPPEEAAQAKHVEQNINNLTVPITSRTASYTSDSSANLSPIQQNFSLPTSPSGPAASLLRGRAKTLASLSTSSAKNIPQVELMPREVQLPHDPYVNGQLLEVRLYKEPLECPICFLYYPPFLNKTRCCDQPICSECFVQIKRPDPHPPEHADPSAPPPPPTEGADPTSLDPDGTLVSEPAACPFCVQPEFGVTFEPPPFRRGLTYANQPSGHSLGQSLPNQASAMSSSSSLASFSANGGQLSPGLPNRRRTTSLSANASTVITTDRVRPDWASKLASARAHAARRSAAATALHTAAYLMGNHNGSSDARSFGGFGRRAVRRAPGGDSPSGGTSSSHLNVLALMSERYATSGNTGALAHSSTAPGEGNPTMTGPPRLASRRNRIDDLEEMMMMEAIRLSLASEEDRRKREEKEAAKEAKKKSKEEKKAEKAAEKAAKKAGLYPSSTNQSVGTLDSPQSGTFSLDNSKGKGIARDGPSRASDTDLASQLSKSAPHLEAPGSSPQTYLEKSRAQLSPNDATYGSAAFKPSHLRNLSNASSSTSSIAESGQAGGSSFEPSPNASGINIPRGNMQETFVSATPPGGGAGMEPMFNFRSLAAMIGTDEKGELDGPAEHQEHADAGDGEIYNLLQGESSGSVHVEQSLTDSVGTLEQSVATLKPEDRRTGASQDKTNTTPHGMYTHNMDYGQHTSAESVPATDMPSKEHDNQTMNHDDTLQHAGSA